MKRIDSNELGIDDVAITGDMYRLERMNDRTFWTCIYRGKHRVCFSIFIEGGKLKVEKTEDSIEDGA